MPDGRQSPGSGEKGEKGPRELYLEVREQGAPVDPGRWLNKAG
jgi:septal ring factor EnvC (AmiA/AmiB activator)